MLIIADSVPIMNRGFAEYKSFCFRFLIAKASISFTVIVHNEMYNYTRLKKVIDVPFFLTISKVV